jgi:hypothetical protein
VNMFLQYYAKTTMKNPLSKAAVMRLKHFVFGMPRSSTEPDVPRMMEQMFLSAQMTRGVGGQDMPVAESLRLILVHMTYLSLALDACMYSSGTRRWPVESLPELEGADFDKYDCSSVMRTFAD